MKVLVTGCAGFIGSHLVEKLLKEGYEVVGIDCFTDYYSRDLKERNLSNFKMDENFTFIEGDIINLNLRKILRDVSYVFHQAAQAGVRRSWGESFDVYVRNNILTTQKLLEACKDSNVGKFIYASSSSVYGDVKKLPMKESFKPKPVSPYGLTKLAGEQLCYLYWKNYNLPAIALRYFTVYGERQRPDMAFHKFIKAILRNEEILIYGSGEQTRDFTYISDVIEATILAMKSKLRGFEIFNVGCGSHISINQVIKKLEAIIGKKAKVRYVEKQKGDVMHTYADIFKAKKMLGWEPKVSLDEGLKRQVEWEKQIYRK